MLYEDAPATAPQLSDTWLLPAVMVIAAGAPGRATGVGGGGLLLPPPPPPPPQAARSANVRPRMHLESPLTRRSPASRRAQSVLPAVAASVRNFEFNGGPQSFQKESRDPSQTRSAEESSTLYIAESRREALYVIDAYDVTRRLKPSL